MIKKIHINEQYLIGFGATAEVYQIAEVEVIKIPRFETREGWWDMEFLIQQKLFNLEIKVPEPFEIVKTELRGEKRWGIRMEYIVSKYPTKTTIPYEENVKLQRMYEREIKKCHKLGFQTADEGLFNSIYSEKRGLFLIDFEGWKFEK